MGNILLAMVIVLALAAMTGLWFAGARRADRYFRAALEAAPSGMMLIEKDGVISFANAEACRLFKYDRLAGMCASQLIPLKGRAAHEDMCRRYFESSERGETYMASDVVVIDKGGVEFSADVRSNAIRRYRKMSALISVIDITERKKTEAALLASNAELEQFAYLASHDMQEPLRMVASYTQLLGEKYRGVLDERADRYIDYATEGAVRMQTLVRDLLSYSRLASAPRVTDVVDLEAVVADTLKDLSETIALSGGAVEVGRLPSAAGDKTQIARIFGNLIGNALKFRGDAPSRVQVTAEQQGVMVAITVSDNGIGIDPRHFERIFLMFQRLHERGKYDGSGIGLSIVKKIVDGHGGRVWINSSLGEGARFTFTLPTVGDATQTLAARGGQSS